MKQISVLILCVIISAATSAVRADNDFLDHLDDYLAVSALHGNVRARVSGLLDVEGYYSPQPASGLIQTEHDFLLNPRLTLFLDTQAGSHVYAFVQARVDRGFDPADQNIQARLDEYVIRFSPWDDGRFSVQLGKFAMVIGNWTQRHYSWENPFVTAPLPYENTTAISDKKAPGSPQEFLGHYQSGGEEEEYAKGADEEEYESDEEYAKPVKASSSYSDSYDRNPIIWGPSYTSGLSVSGQIGKLSYAGEIKNASVSSRPESWDATEIGFDHPSFNTRFGFRPNEMWNLGVSASTGSYLRPEAEAGLPAGRDIGDYREILFGQDVSFAWHHWQVWAECFETRFQVPNVGNADTLAYYLEAKYKFMPQLFGALRWNQQLFATVRDGEGGREAWGEDLWRIDCALGYRLTNHLQLKLQYSLGHQSADWNHTVAGQATVRF